MPNSEDWEDPYYDFEVARRKFRVDLTQSAPNFDVPIDCLTDVAAEFRDRGVQKILDFGAGKLRNTLYLLRRRWNFKVWAVEFKECYETPFAKRQLQAAKRFRDFFFLEYPKDFLDFDGSFDAALLVNVANIIPMPEVRVRVLEECAKRLRSGGVFLWMSQYGEPNYRPGVTKRLRLNDGWIYNLYKTYQTFVREDYTLDEIREAVLAHPYRELRRVASRHNRGFLFEKQ